MHNGRGGRARLFGFEVDRLRMAEAVNQLLKWAAVRDGVCRYVVTPNADHAVVYQENAELRQAYAEASLILVDGMPLLVAAKLLRRGVPERVPGSDLVPAIFSAASARQKVGGGAATRELRIYLLGAGPGVAERAAGRIEATWPGVKVVGSYSPPLGFEKDPTENDAILARITASGCDVLVVGLAPRSRSCGSRSIATGSPRPWPFASGRRSTFWPAKKRKRQFGCAA